MTFNTSTTEDRYPILGNHIASLTCIKAPDQSAPETLISFEFLNQGAANAVFRILPFPCSSDTIPFQFITVSDANDLPSAVPYALLADQVLRISRGKPKHLTGEAILNGFAADIIPLFVPGEIDVLTLDTSEGDTSSPVSTLTRTTLPLSMPDYTSFLMHHQPALITSAVLSDLHLRTNDTFHMPSFPSTTSPSPARMGILLPDMSAHPGRSLTLELKPKWLLQSPSAPPSAARCRTCAMHLAVPKDSATYLCPLTIMHGVTGTMTAWADQAVQKAAAATRTAAQAGPTSALVRSIRDALVEYLTAGPGRILLLHVCFLQSSLDPQGVLYCPAFLHARPASRDAQALCALFRRNLRLAMTLRDCSLLVTIPYDDAGARVRDIVGKLGDLDFKSEEKMGDWESKEKMLIERGWYTRERGEEGGCFLERAREA